MKSTTLLPMRVAEWPYTAGGDWPGTSTVYLVGVGVRVGVGVGVGVGLGLGLGLGFGVGSGFWFGLRFGVRYRVSAWSQCNAPSRRCRSASRVSVRPTIE